MFLITWQPCKNSYTKHQEANGSDQEVEWVIIRTGPKPITVNFDGWDEGLPSLP